MILDYFDKQLLIDRLLKINKNLIILVCIIFSCGLLLLYSASNGSVKPWAIRQLIYFLAFFPIMILIAIIDIKFWFKHSYVVYAGGLFLLLLVVDWLATDVEISMCEQFDLKASR